MEAQESLSGIPRRQSSREIAEPVARVVVGNRWSGSVVGRAEIVGVLQTRLSKKLRPPVKWSYLKLVGWFGLSCLSKHTDGL
jgi:hypothetical protein